MEVVKSEDIADLPDLNLAESLQRIPGVAITRSNGEGAQITVRGLSGAYTRTRVNGMDTRVGIAGNGSRSFDFNLFASELFNEIVVHKTATAALGEGSLGSVVDLNTARAFDYKKGFTALASAQGAYNDLSGTLRPRLAGLVAYGDPHRTWGATASVAYSNVHTDSLATDTVEWQKGNFRSVKGVTCNRDPTAETDPGCKEVADAFHARIPRYVQSVITAERLGLTAGVQLRPTKQTELRLDALYATFTEEQNTRTIEALLRSNQVTTDVVDYSLQANPARANQAGDLIGNDTLSYLKTNNTNVRSESFLLQRETGFQQLTLGIDHDFTDDLYVALLAGISRSKSDRPHQTGLMYDNNQYDGYSYDYRQDDLLPSLVFGGPDVADYANFQLTTIRDEPATELSGFDTVDLKLHWDTTQWIKLLAGANYKNSAFRIRQRNRNQEACDFYHDCDLDDDGTNDIDGIPAEQALTEITVYDGEVGAGTATRWASPNIDGWVDRLDYYSAPLAIDLSNTRSVEEKTLAFFLQADGEVPLGHLLLVYNAGVTYAQTRQVSDGYKGITYEKFTRPMYDDWLPSANVSLWVTNDLALRLAAARVLSRPALASLTPGAAISGFRNTVIFQNPLLDPTRATALDASIEWYFDDEALASLALFHKEIASFEERPARTATFASTGLPVESIGPSPGMVDPEACGDPQGCWTITELFNGPGASLQGFEVGIQAPLTAFYGGLPPVIEGLGFQTNFTYVDSVTKTEFQGLAREDRLAGLSSTSFNATLYYEDSKFGARMSVANRSDYLGGNSPDVRGNLWWFTESSTRLDFSSSYQLLKELEFSFEALNLTDTPDQTTIDLDSKRPRTNARTGRNFLLGARYTY